MQLTCIFITFSRFSLLFLKKPWDNPQGKIFTLLLQKVRHTLHTGFAVQVFPKDLLCSLDKCISSCFGLVAWVCAIWLFVLHLHRLYLRLLFRLYLQWAVSSIRPPKRWMVKGTFWAFFQTPFGTCPLPQGSVSWLVLSLFHQVFPCEMEWGQFPASSLPIPGCDNHCGTALQIPIATGAPFHAPG